MIYRLQQLWWALFAPPLSAQQMGRVRAILNSAELLALYTKQSRNDQQHTLRIVHLLDQKHYKNTSLLKAALLHDVGKVRLRLTILDRCFIVLASVLMRQRAASWGKDPNPPYRQRKAFVIREWHPAWGADMAEAAGADTLTVRLIARHQTKGLESGNREEDELLRQLQWADDQS